MRVRLPLPFAPAAPLLTLGVVALFCGSCGDADPIAPSTGEAPGTVVTATAPMDYAHPPGYCEDTDPDGNPWAPQRPVWSDLEGDHYDGIVHTDGAQSIRYPDYRNVSHNLAVLESLQFLLSTVTNVTNKVEDAQAMLQEGTYVDGALGLIPQVDGHCVCINGSCDPATVLSDAEAVVTELLDVHNIETVLQDYIDQKVDATVADLEDLLTYFEDAVQPSGLIATTLEQALYDAIDDEIQAAILEMTGVAAPECTASAFANPSDYTDAIEAAVVAAVAELEAELQADVQIIQDAVDLAVGTPGAVLNQLQLDLETVQGFFAGVDSFEDLVQLDWPLLVSTLQDMVPFYQDTIEDIQAAIDDLTGVWEDITTLQDRIEDLADQVYADAMANLAATNPEMAACVAALQDVNSFNPGAYDPSDFADNLTASLEDAIETIWTDMSDRVEQTWQSIEDRITGIGLEDGLAIFNAWTGDAQAAITSTVQACYMRGPRPDCYDHCGADSQDDFIWMPVDFLQDPEALAAGAASGALFALEQTGWLDDLREWVETQMESELGAAFTSVLGFLGDFAETIEEIIEFLGEAFEYVDLFTEGYHLGAYSDLRPDLHMCVGYYGHGAYAQMGNLGGDRFSIGARYSSHNLSARNRVQFRSGGFAVSAFGYDLSLLPGIEFNWQMDGFKLWDQTRPFGIPMNASINPNTVARLDVFNVVPMDRYPFGFTEGVPIEDQSFPAGAFLVRDLFPSRPAFAATPDWPRPGVTDPWEQRSIAVMSMGLNLKLDYPADGPEYIELPTLQIIPTILTVTPLFGFQLGVEWEHQVDLLRDRVLEKVNASLPADLQIDDADFSRDMHAMQAPDLTADNRTSAYVEPSLAIDAFLGFKLWKIRVGAGARLGLGVNIRPAGGGGILDLNAALADALTNSNPPADAECTPVWDWSETYECSNLAFPDSDGDFSCSPAESINSCCMTIALVLPGRTERYSMCVDDWTGITQEYCEYLDVPNASLEQAAGVIEGLPGFLGNLKSRLLALIDGARAVTIDGTWRAGSSCAERACGGGEFEEVFSTAFLNVQGLAECEQFGYCTYDDGTIVHDVSTDRCENGTRSWIDVSTGGSNSCAVESDGSITCWSPTGSDLSTVPTGAYTQVSVDQNYGCAIAEADGHVDCWRMVGTFDLGQTNAPTGAFTEIAAGVVHTCGIKADGTIACWGGWASQPTASQFIPAGTWVQIESGYNRSCAINSSHEMVCFGEQSLPQQVLGASAIYDVSMSGYLGVCVLRADGSIECGNMDPIGFGTSGECTAAQWGTLPAGPFSQITDGTLCGGCGLRADGTTACWGGAASTGALGISASRIAGNSHNGPGMCGIDAAGTLACAGRAATGVPTNGPTGVFTPYSCRTVTDGEVTGWEGPGCHPLQQGFASACGCAADEDCGTGETCSDEGACSDGTSDYSCGCDTTADCGGGRVCVAGACALTCAVTTDCPGGLECVSGACVPQFGIQFAEQIVWGMENVENPIHLISSFSLSEIYATLKLTVNLYVELSFKLFGKERKWRVLDFNRGYDLGSTWKGWYQPGLEARYQDECESPLLGEPMTNRFPRSLTSNPYDAAFDAAGVDLGNFCTNGGVCRYRDPLPMSETDPGDYALGNVGTVSEFLDYCFDDYPEHQQNPNASTNGDIIGSVVDTYQFGHDVTLEIWATNQVCVDGVVWDEWLAGLEPTLDEEGNVLDAGALDGYNCEYTDPSTGAVTTFGCDEITQNMLATWGCLSPTANVWASALATQFPSLVVSHPTAGAVLDIDAMFTAVASADPVFGPGLTLDYELANMIATYRYYTRPFPLLPNVGAGWLAAVDACFGARFDSPAETACECADDGDCDVENGQFCQTGVCMQALTDLDGTEEIVRVECPIVQLVAEVGACCGDGIVQNTAGYGEECDDGPDGSPTCTANCQAVNPRDVGACCAGDGVCYENLGAEACADQGGTFTPGADCATLNYCEGDDGGGSGGPLGVCCTASACLENMTRERCAPIGTWTVGADCEAVDFCVDTIVTYGACCTAVGCYDGVSAQQCEGHGAFNPGVSCADINACVPVDPTGSCCLPDGTCADGLGEAACAAFGGAFGAGTTCGVDVECGAPVTGACCVGDACVEATTEVLCVRRGGVWNGGSACEDIGYCRVDVPQGACCVDDACVEDASDVDCERAGGTFTLDATCAGVNYCRVEVETGACCVDEGCYEQIAAVDCADKGGTFSLGQTCEDVNYCRVEEPTGACCDGRTCTDGVTALACERFGGTFSEGAACDAVDCGGDLPPVGGCCVPGGLCLEAVTEAECTAQGGLVWTEDALCADCGCSLPVDDDGGATSTPGGGTCAAGRGNASTALWLGVAMVVLRRRRRRLAA